MSNTMHANRRALLEQAKSLGIQGRHKMNSGVLRQRIQDAQSKQNQGEAVVGHLTFSPGGFIPTLSSVNQGLEAIREARRNVKVDDFPLGTVIRWEADAHIRVYLYAAIKTPVGWATTAQPHNPYVDGLVEFEDLLEILSRSETQNVQVSESWKTI